MNKNTIIPFLIIIVAVIIGGFVLLGGDNRLADKQLVVAPESLRKLELSVPGMSCVGCTASVEGYISSVEGVKRVQARLAPVKSATVVYDSRVVTKEEIVENQVFDLYGVSIISDDSFSGSILPTESKEGIVVPQEIQEKSRQVILLFQQKSGEGKDVSVAQSLFNQVNSNIEEGNFPNASSLLDTISDTLKSL